MKPLLTILLTFPLLSYSQAEIISAEFGEREYTLLLREDGKWVEMHDETIPRRHYPLHISGKNGKNYRLALFDDEYDEGDEGVWWPMSYPTLKESDLSLVETLKYLERKVSLYGSDKHLKHKLSFSSEDPCILSIEIFKYDEIDLQYNLNLRDIDINHLEANDDSKIIFIYTIGSEAKVQVTRSGKTEMRTHAILRIVNDQERQRILDALGSACSLCNDKADPFD